MGWPKLKYDGDGSEYWLTESGKTFDTRRQAEEFAGSYNADVESAKAYAEAMAPLLEAQQVDPMEAIRVGNAQSTLNILRFPMATAKAKKESTAAAEYMDEYMRDRFFTDLGRASTMAGYEGFRDMGAHVLGSTRTSLEEVERVASEMITGELPTDVRDFIERTRAEMNISQGRYGPAGRYAMARDLGKTSLDMVNAGTSLYAEAVPKLSQQLQGQIAAFMPPTTDITALYSSMLQQLTGVANVNPVAAMQVNAQVGLANAEARWTSQLSALNAGLDILSGEKNLEMANMAANAAQNAGMWQGIGSAVGGISQAIAISDRRLKRNIEQIGNLPSGLPVYEYDIFNRHEIGVMADEVAGIFPEAVLLHRGGFLMVDYAKIA